MLNNIPMIDILLRQLGLHEKEIEIYLCILEKGKILPAELAKITHINRSTVYSVTRELLKKGIITEDLGGPSKYLVALPPEDLYNLIRQEEKNLQLKKAKLNTAIEQLHLITKNTKYVVPKITFIPEEDLAHYLHKRIPMWIESMRLYDNTCWGFQDKTFTELFQDWIDSFWHQATPNLYVKLLSNASTIEKRLKKKGYERRLIRPYGSSHQFTSTIWVHGDFLVLIFTKQHPFYLVEIHDKVLSYNLRELFKRLWESTEV